MDIFEAIENRRSQARLLPDTVERHTIEKVLSAALWAPNHHHTEPWYFYVLQGAARHDLSEALMTNFHRDNPDATEKEIRVAEGKNPKRVLKAPVVVVVSCEPGKDDIESQENYAACACAVQNILLASEALGLGVYWRTGNTLYTSPNAVNELLQIPQETSLVALLLMGYPEAPPRPSSRQPLSQKIEWYG